jgi:thymidine kinase
VAQLFFRYGTINAGKSIELIKVAYNYQERGRHVLVLTAGKKDEKDGRGVVRSRIGVEREADIIREDTNILQTFMEENFKKHVDCVLIDESHFMKKHHIEELTEIVDSFDCPVMCYGLKNDFRNELFEGSHYLLVYADKIEEIKSICWCGRKATMSARVVNGKMVRTGDQIMVGENAEYVPLCRRHYNEGRLGPDYGEQE